MGPNNMVKCVVLLIHIWEVLDQISVQSMLHMTDVFRGFSESLGRLSYKDNVIS